MYLFRGLLLLNVCPAGLSKQEVPSTRGTDTLYDLRLLSTTIFLIYDLQNSFFKFYVIEK